MFNKNSESKERYSLRKYKGVGAASVLLGALAITHPALAADPAPTETTVTENSGSTAENADAKKYEADSGVRDNKDGTSTIYNRYASYTLPTENIVKDKTREPGYVDKYGRHVYEYNEEEYNKYNEQGEKLAKEQYAKNEEKETKGSEDFKDATVKYVTRGDGKEVEIKDATVEDTDGDESYKINGRFGKKYTGTNVAFDESKIKSDDVITTKDGKVYHKIDTEVTKGDGTATKTKLNDVELNITPKGLHKEDGSIDYSKIKDGSRIFLVTETDEGKYDKYLVINKDAKTNDTSIADLFKTQAANAKTFNNENLKTENDGIKDGDIVLVVEKNEFAVLPDKVTMPKHEMTGHTESSLEDILGYMNTWLSYDSVLKSNIVDKVEDKKWEDVYPVTLLEKINNENTINILDNKERPIYDLREAFIGIIREKGDFKEYIGRSNFLNALNEKFGEKLINIGWDIDRDKVEPKFVSKDVIIELEGNEYYYSPQAGDIDDVIGFIEDDEEKEKLKKYKEEHLNIEYVENIPKDVIFKKMFSK